KAPPRAPLLFPDLSPRFRAGVSSFHVIRGRILYRLDELIEEADQFIHVTCIPRREDGAAHAGACLVQPVGHRLALAGDDRFADPAIRSAGAALDKPEAFKLRHLAADRGVVAAGPVGEVDDADRTEAVDADQQREEGAV